MSVGSPVIAKSPMKPESDHEVGSLVLGVLVLLVGDDPEADADRILLPHLGERGQHRRQGALHVIGAATVEAVTLDPRLELLGVGRDDVDVTVQDDGRAVIGANLGEEHRQLADRFLARLDAARLEPALDEARAKPEPVGLAGVVRDQPLGEGDEVRQGLGLKPRGEH